MLTCDGIEADAFVAAWREAMWTHTDVLDRTRLVLELGRLHVRELGAADPLAVALSPSSDEPFVLIPLREMPFEERPEARRALRDKLGTLGATEVYLLVTQATRSSMGGPAFLLSAYGDGGAGREAVWMMPYRTSTDGLDQAQPMAAPEPAMTVLAQKARGLLPSVH